MPPGDGYGAPQQIHQLTGVVSDARLETLPRQDHQVTAEAMTPAISRFCG